MEPKPIVLGSEFAAALAAERARLASGVPGPSPLGGRSYDRERDEFNLTVLVQSPLDLEIEALVKSYRELEGDERDALRQRLSLADNYTLLHFARRMAVRALNHSSPEPCDLGLVALAMIDESRIDQRDALWAAGLLNHAASRWPDRSTQMFERAIALATSGMGELLRRSEGASTLDDWGYREVRTAAGIGLIQSGWGRYEPTLDLAEVATRVADQVLASRYVAEVEIAAELPSVWFDRRRRDHAEETLERALGVAAIHGTLRRTFGDGTGQMLVIWIAEMPESDDCVELVADVGDGAANAGRYVVGVSAGRLFALLVAGSTQKGIEAYESPSTLAELAARARVLLAEWAGARSE